MNEVLIDLIKQYIEQNQRNDRSETEKNTEPPTRGNNQQADR